MNLNADFSGLTALVTGATSGIGRAIALGLESGGAEVTLLARNEQALSVMASRSSRFRVCALDLADDNELRRLAGASDGKLDILVHSAGTCCLGPVASAGVEQFDFQYRVNVRAPYLLTQLLLPSLVARRGQIVFINSTAAMNSKANASQYAATKSALRAVADSLRDEVNALGVRVITVYPGRTATPMQAAVLQAEHRAWDESKLMAPDDVAGVVLHAMAMPRSAEVTDISMRPMQKL